MENSYWHRSMANRLTRRRALTLTAGGFAAAAFLAACGNDDESGPPLLSKITDTSANATKGGTLVRARDNAFTSMDMSGSNSDKFTHKFVYSALTKLKEMKHPEPIRSEAEGDAASAWEVSPDGLRYTFKLRPGIKFDPRPPTSGRLLTAADVIYSVERFTNLSTTASLWLQSKAAPNPVVGFEAPNDSTVVMKLAYPYLAAPLMAAHPFFFVIMPAVSANQYDAKNEMRGSSAWRLREARSGDRLLFEKNPDWYDESKIFLDGFTDVIILDYAVRQAQFLAGHIANFEMNQEEVLKTKRDRPDLLLIADDSYTHQARTFRLSRRSGSPFNDVRVRRAVSMLVDRDLFVKTIFNVPEFEAAGLPINMRWDTSFQCDDDSWLDPRGSKFGGNAKYFSYDPKEAKSLLKAAGFEVPIKEPMLTSDQFTSTVREQTEIVAGMLEAHGDFLLERRVLNQTTQFQSQVTFGRGLHEGIGWSLGGPTYADPDFSLSSSYSSTSTTSSVALDPEDERLFLKQRMSTNADERVGIFHELQRRAAGEMATVNPWGATVQYRVNNPSLQNFGLWRKKTDRDPASYLWLKKA